MDELLQEINTAMRNEYALDDEKLGSEYNSRHEAYAAMREGFEKAWDESGLFEGFLKKYWDSIKTDTEGSPWPVAMQKCAVNIAAKWAQVAAMCRKAQL
jgi:hypothetical protein